MTVFANVQRTDQETGQLIDRWVQVGRTILQKGPFDTPPTPDETRQHAQDLVKALSLSIQLNKSGKMAPSSPERMSGLPPSDLTREQVITIWDQIPSAYKNSKHSSPRTTSELVSALQGLFCNHPREAALALGDQSGEQEWDASIEQMEISASHRCPDNTSTHPGGRSTLFKASDVPRFTSTKEYDDFRSSLLMFLQSTEYPAPHEYGMALLRILSTFEDPVAKQAAKGWNVQPLVHRSSWEITYRQFLQALDDKFQSATLLQDTKLEWMRCRPKEGEKPTDFFNRFEALTAQLMDVQERTNAPVLSDTVITERILMILPRYLTDDARQNVARTGEMLELKTPKELRKYFEISWAYLPKPAATGHNTKSNYQTGTSRNAPAQSGQSRNETKQRQCGLIVSYDDAPAVPESLRGSLFPDPKNPQNNAANSARRQRCAQHQVCTYCRRPQTEHHASGPNFKVVTMPPTTRAALAATPLPESRQIEAPPSAPLLLD